MTQQDEQLARAARQIELGKQAGLRNLVKASLMVTTGLVQTSIAAQTLVG